MEIIQKQQYALCQRKVWKPLAVMDDWRIPEVEDSLMKAFLDALASHVMKLSVSE